MSNGVIRCFNKSQIVSNPILISSLGLTGGSRFPHDVFSSQCARGDLAHIPNKHYKNCAIPVQKLSISGLVDLVRTIHTQQQKLGPRDV
jgi:hypothetical protein